MQDSEALTIDDGVDEDANARLMASLDHVRELVASPAFGAYSIAHRLGKT